MTTTPTTPTPPPLPHVLSVDELPSIFSDLVPIEQPPSSVCQIQYKADFAIAYNYFRALLQQRPDEASDRALRLTELCASMNPSNYSVWQHRRTIYRKLWQVGDKEVTVGAVEASAAEAAGAAAAISEEKVGAGAGAGAAAAAAAATAAAAAATGDSHGDGEAGTGDTDAGNGVGDAAATSTTATAATANASEASSEPTTLPPKSDVRSTKVRYELELAARLGGANPKTYQVWYHRRAVVEHLMSQEGPTPSTKPASSSGCQPHDVGPLLREILRSELEYLRGVVKVDGKNYHAWSYRQFLVMTTLKLLRDDDNDNKDDNNNDPDDNNPSDGKGPAELLLSDELAYTADLIQDEIRNNSAWNHRWFANNQLTKLRGEKEERDKDWDGVNTLEQDLWKAETAYALEVAWADPYNESPWRYYVAAVRRHVHPEVGIGHPPLFSWWWIRKELAEHEQRVWNVMVGAKWVVDEAFLDPSECNLDSSDEEGSAGDEKGEDDDDDSRYPTSALPDLDDQYAVSPHLLAAVVDLIEMTFDDDDKYEGDDGYGVVDSDASTEPDPTPRIRAVHICRCLQVVDPIRNKYWRQRARAIFHRWT